MVILAIAAGVTSLGLVIPAPGDFAYVLDVKLIPQQGTALCWAAATSMVLNYWNKKIAQCEIARNLDSQTGIAGSNVYCTIAGTNQIPKATPIANHKGGPDRVLPNYGTTLTTTCSAPQSNCGVLAWATLVQQMQQRRPVICTWKWDDNASHIMVVSGAKISNGARWVRINDPLPVNVGDQVWMTYECYDRSKNQSGIKNHTHGSDYYNISAAGQTPPPYQHNE